MEKNIFSSDYADIIYIKELKLIKLIWKRNPKFDEYKGAFLKLVEFTEHENEVENVITDTREQGVVPPEFRKWLEKEGLPKAIDKGLKRTGIVFDGHIFKKYYLNMILKVVNKFGVPMKLFNTEEEAVNWIKSFQ